MGTRIVSSTATPLRRAGTNRHLRTARSAARSNMARPELSAIVIATGRPSSSIRTSSTTRPSSLLRTAARGYRGFGHEPVSFLAATNPSVDRDLVGRAGGVARSGGGRGRAAAGACVDFGSLWGGRWATCPLTGFQAGRGAGIGGIASAAGATGSKVSRGSRGSQGDKAGSSSGSTGFRSESGSSEGGVRENWKNTSGGAR